MNDRLRFERSTEGFALVHVNDTARTVISTTRSMSNASLHFHAETLVEEGWFGWNMSEALIQLDRRAAQAN